MANSIATASIAALTSRVVMTQNERSVTTVIESVAAAAGGVAKMIAVGGAINNPAQIKSANTTATTTGATVSTLATTKDDNEKPSYMRMFNKIVLTLENSLIPEDKLEKTPSFTDGLDPETEKDLRILGCELIQTAGILLKLPQVAMATGQVLFQRFFYSKSFVRHNMETVAMSCLCLASKIEEAPRRIRDVMNVFHHIKQVRAQKDITPMIVDQYYTNQKTQVIKAERRVLKELGFCVHVKHPHKLIVMYLQVLKYETHEKLMQMSWNFMNDSLRTDVFMRHQPETIACACIYLSARKLGIPLPKNPPWFGVFRVSEDDIISICYCVMELYIREKVNVEKLEQSVEELKKRYLETRNKLKEANTLTATTTVDRNNGSHNAWGGFIQRALPLPLSTDKLAERNTRSRSRSRSAHSRSQNSRSHSDSPRERSRSPRLRTGSNSPRIRSRSRSVRSRTNSRSNSDDSPGYRKSKKAVYVERKKKSRHYSRSASNSPYEKHRRRKLSRTRERERDRDVYTYTSSSKEMRLSSNVVDKYRNERDHRDRERDRHERERETRSSNHRNSSSSNKQHYQSRSSYNHYSSSGGGANSRSSNKHYESERSRDRKR